MKATNHPPHSWQQLGKGWVHCLTFLSAHMVIVVRNLLQSLAALSPLSHGISPGVQASISHRTKRNKDKRIG
jgi:hypothetical protein